MTVHVLSVPVERFMLTLEDVESLSEEEVIERGITVRICSSVMACAPLSGHICFDMMSVCMNLKVGCVRVHHIRGSSRRSHGRYGHGTKALATRRTLFSRV